MYGFKIHAPQANVKSLVCQIIIDLYPNKLRTVGCTFLHPSAIPDEIMVCPALKLKRSQNIGQESSAYQAAFQRHLSRCEELSKFHLAGTACCLCDSVLSRLALPAGLGPAPHAH